MCTWVHNRWKSPDRGDCNASQLDILPSLHKAHVVEGEARRVPHEWFVNNGRYDGGAATPNPNPDQGISRTLCLASGCRDLGLMTASRPAAFLKLPADLGIELYETWA